MKIEIREVAWVGSDAKGWTLIMLATVDGKAVVAEYEEAKS